MLKINRTLFFESYPFRPLKQEQVNALNFLLDRLDESETITRLSEYAYVLATIKLETGDTFEPVREAYWLKPESRRIAVLKKMYKGRSSIIHPSGKLYTGNGYVQLTHIDNYIRMSPYVREHYPEVDIVENPELACKPEVAWIILETGMTKGLFTGKKLSDYFTDSKCDFYYARKIINGLDRAGLVQSYAQKFYDVLEFEQEESGNCQAENFEAKKAIDENPLPEENVLIAEAAITDKLQASYNELAFNINEDGSDIA